MILDTKVVLLPGGAGSEQQASTELSQYLLDADLSNLGRVDFFECLDRVIEEGELPRLDHYIATLGLVHGIGGILGWLRTCAWRARCRTLGSWLRRLNG